MPDSSLRNAHGPVLSMSGPIDASSRMTLRAMIDEGLARGQRDFILDLQEVSFVDSAGLGALVACFSTVQKHAGTLKLVHVPKRVYELVEMTGLANFFDIDHGSQ